jgi:3-oxoacyl-[acyl-carrier-protein] synthase-3
MVHPVHDVVLWADGTGRDLARRRQPGYLVDRASRGEHYPPGNSSPTGEDDDPWIRMEGPALFRRATEAFADLIRRSLHRTGWSPDDLRWVIPHQANGRILRAAARRSGVPAERFFINLDHVGNTSSASIPLALAEVEPRLGKGDKLLLCSVGAGLTGAAVTLQW